MKIDCGTCRMRGQACGHCVVSVLLGRGDENTRAGSEPDGLLNLFDPDDVFDLTEDERAAVSALSAGGLIPPLHPVFADPVPVDSAPVDSVPVNLVPVELVPLRRCGPAA